MAYDPNRLRSEERISVMAFGMLGDAFDYYLSNLDKRYERAGYKYVKRDLGLMRAAFKRLWNEALKGVDDATRRHLILQTRDFEIRAVRTSAPKDKETVTMSLEDEWQFVQITVDSRCKICLATGAECRDCGVRKLLRRYITEPECGALTECGYQGCDVNDHKKLNKQERL